MFLYGTYIPPRSRTRRYVCAISLKKSLFFGGSCRNSRLVYFFARREWDFFPEAERTEAAMSISFV